MSENKVDNQNFFVHFLSVFTVPEMNKAFQTYLKLIEKIEDFRFIERIDELLNLKKNTEVIKTLWQFQYDYLSKNSLIKIPLPDSYKNEANNLLTPQFESNNLDQWVIEKNLSDILEPLREYMVQLLRLDVFPRFINSEFCTEVLQKFPNDDRIFFPKTAQKFDFSDEDFKEPIITEKDWNFMKALLFHSLDFNVIESKQNYFIDGRYYYSTLNYCPGVSFFKNPVCLKFEFVLPYSFDKLISALAPLDSIYQTDPMTTNVQVLKSYSSEKMSKKSQNATKCGMLEICGDEIYPFPLNFLNPRKWFSCTSWDFDPKTKTLFRISKPYLHDFIKDINLQSKHSFEVCVDKKSRKIEKKSCLLLFSFTMTSIRKIADNLTQYTQTNYFDINGIGNMIQTTFIKKLATTRGEGLAKNLKKLVEKSNENIFEKSDDKLVNMLKELDIKEIQNDFEKEMSKLDDISRRDVRRAYSILPSAPPDDYRSKKFKRKYSGKLSVDEVPFFEDEKK